MDKDGRYRWALQFDAIDCFGCGERRPRGLDCPACGRRSDPREVDRVVARRCRIVAEARRLVEADASQPMVGRDLEELRSHTKAALSALFHSMSHLADAEADETPTANKLGAALITIKNLNEAITTGPRYRPERAVWNGLARAIDGLERASTLWISAFTEQDPVQAEKYAAQAHATLNAAPEQFAAANRASADLEQALKDGGSAQALGLFAARGIARATKHDSPSAAVLPLYRQATNRDDLPDELALALLVEDERAYLLFDRERFWSVVESTYKELTESEGFNDLANDPDWRRAYEASLQTLTDAGHLAESVAANAYHTRQIVRADLALAKALVEGPAKMVLRTLLAAKSRRRFDQTSHDAGSVLDQARQVGLTPLLDGLNKQLRNADSHEDYLVDGKKVILSVGSRHEVTFSFASFADEVLTGLESTLAMYLAVTLVLRTVDLAFATKTAALALSPEQACYLSLGIAGEPVEKIEVRSNSVEVAYSADFTNGTFSAIAGTAWALPTRLTRLRIRSPGKVLEGPLAPMREFDQSRTDVDRTLSIWRALTQWRLDGRPVADRALCRCWAASEAARSHRQSPSDAIQYLRAIRRFAIDQDDQELSDLLTDMIRFHRHRLLEEPLEPSTIDRTLARVRMWAMADVRWPDFVPGKRKVTTTN